MTIIDDTKSADWGPPSGPRPSAGFAALAIIGAAALLVLVCAVLWNLRGLLIAKDLQSAVTDTAMALTLIPFLALFWPGLRSAGHSVAASRLLTSGDVADARAEAAHSRSYAAIAFGYGAALLVVVGLIAFFSANDGEVVKTFFNGPLIIQFFGAVARAFGTNVFIFLVAEVLILVWGLMVAMARLLPGEAGKPIRLIATFYCDVFRGFPAIVTIYMIGFGLPLAGVPLVSNLPLVWYAIIALTIVYGAYVGEVYRSGIESVHWSQMAAARSLGLSYGQAMRYVIIPQAIRRIVPPLLNDFIGLQKDTSLVQVIGVMDAFTQSRIIASNHFNLSAVTIVGLLFVLVTIPQARLVDRLVEADQRRMRAGGA